MTASFPPMYRLTARGGVGLACDEQGIALGPVILVEALAAGGGRVFRPRPAEEIARTLALAYDDLAPADIARCLLSLDLAAKALEARDLAKASVAAVLLKLPDLSVEGFAKLAADPSLKKYSPTEPRISAGQADGGQWTSAGTSGAIPANDSTPKSLRSIVCPVPNAAIRGSDAYGSGAYGARRDGGKRPHPGVDIVAAPGTAVSSPVSGTVRKVEPYPDPKKRGKLHGVEITTDDGHKLQVLYVDTTGLQTGQRIAAGDPLGPAEDLSLLYPPKTDAQGNTRPIINHIHLAVRGSDGTTIDPTSLLLSCKPNGA